MRKLCVAKQHTVLKKGIVISFLIFFLINALGTRKSRKKRKKAELKNSELEAIFDEITPLDSNCL